MVNIIEQYWISVCEAENEHVLHCWCMTIYFHNYITVRQKYFQLFINCEFMGNILRISLWFY